MEILGALITLSGAMFLLIGALGVYRMPDVYNRMQAGTKATTLGSLLFLTGLALGHPDLVPGLKILVLILFVVFTNPLSSHALARAAHFIGVPMTEKTVRDDLAADEQNNGEIYPETDGDIQ